MTRIFLSLLLVLGFALPSAAQQRANQLFGSKDAPSRQTPAAIGTYAKGCAAGLMELPENGPTWQAMRLSRHRNFGHPEMIDFLKDLSQTAAQIGWKGLYIGDISQPRGGPMTSGHQSHQIGLDADIWLLPPKRLNLSRREREKISSLNVRSADQRSVNGNWTRAHQAIIKAAASDPRVDRIFITAPAKVAMCKNATRKDKKWLQKVRPLYGHNTHFHVRLKCPKGSSNCVTQKPTVKELSKGGDGCDSTLNWWVTDYLNPPKTKPKATKKKSKKQAPKKRGAREYTMADLPKQCSSVLASR